MNEIYAEAIANELRATLITLVEAIEKCHTTKAWLESAIRLHEAACERETSPDA